MGTVIYANVNGELLSETRDGVRKLYIPDALGNTVAMMDSTGALTDTFDYFPSGTVASRTGTTPTPFQWVGNKGYYRDNSKRTHVRERNFYVNLGRWAETDPIGFRGGDYNLYRYVKNRFVVATDPSGLVQLKKATKEWDVDSGCAQKTKCGAFAAYWYITLSPTPPAITMLGKVLGVVIPSPTRGQGPHYFVQWVRMTLCDKNGKNCNEVYNYCESWTVKSGETSPYYIGNTGRIGYDDGFTYPGGPNSGVFGIGGEIKFFNRATVVPGTGGKTIGDVVGGWQPTPDHPAGTLPHGDCQTWFKQLPSDDYISAEHYANSSWDCSDPEKKNWKSCSNAAPR